MIKLPDHTLAEFLTNESIEWNFIPSRSPNHGGLWEAGVKAFKFHLKRVVGNAHLTLEELITILCEIEAVLNSRPLTPLTSNFDDFEALTPGHFLVGRPLTSIVEAQITNINENQLSRWERFCGCYILDEDETTLLSLEASIKSVPAARKISRKSCSRYARVISSREQFIVSNVDDSTTPANGDEKDCYRLKRVHKVSSEYENCPAIQAGLFKISPEDPENLIFSDKAVEAAQTVFDNFGAI
ncbi:integrase catalytic domain-containing protein [Trichonephila clavipes]|nr:integrase catalytic domain-containing protein [Trichonephila clavipes]